MGGNIEVKILDEGYNYEPQNEVENQLQHEVIMNGGVDDSQRNIEEEKMNLSYVQT